MGEITDMILEGILCQVCGTYLEESEGCPTTCADCLDDEEEIGE